MLCAVSVCYGVCSALFLSGMVYAVRCFCLVRFMQCAVSVWYDVCSALFLSGTVYAVRCFCLVRCMQCAVSVWYGVCNALFLSGTVYALRCFWLVAPLMLVAFSSNSLHVTVQKHHHNFILNSYFRPLQLCSLDYIISFSAVLNIVKNASDRIFTSWQQFRVIRSLVLQLALLNLRGFYLKITNFCVTSIFREAKSKFTMCIVTFYTECPTRYRTRHFFNNSNTNEDIATKFETEYIRCVKNEEECVCSAPNFCDIEQRSAS
jgi:hypothetical protein